MEFNEQEFNEVQNTGERRAEALYPGYRGPVYGERTIVFTGFDFDVDTAPCALLF